MTEIIAAIITALSGMLSSWLSFRGNRSTSVSGNELEQMKALFPEEYSRLIKLQLAARIWEYQDQGRGEIAERICLAGIVTTIGLVLFLFVLNALGETNDGNSYVMYSGLVNVCSYIPLILLFVLGVEGCGRIVGPFGPVRSSRVQSIRKKKGPRDAGAHR